MGGGDLGLTGDYAAVFYVWFDREAGPAGDYASGILLRVCGVRTGVADRVFDYRVEPCEVAANDDTLGVLFVAAFVKTGREGGKESKGD